MKYNFDEIINRKCTSSSKWDNVGPRVGNPNALPMWVADMDFRCPQPVVDAVIQRAKHMIYGYPYVTDDFREALIHWVEKRHEWDIKSEWIVFSTGVVPVFNTVIQEFTDVGDKVIIQRPVYHPFGFAVDDNNREISDNSLIYKDGKYTIDFEDLERKAKDPKAKVMIFCNPHNPVGRVWNKEELLKVADICLHNHVILISDEIHSDLMLFGHKHIPLASLGEAYAMNTITCYAPSKTFNTAGLRGSGIVIPNSQLRERLEKRFKQNRSIQQNIFALPGFVAAYNQREDYLEQLIPYLEENVRFLEKFLHKNMPKIKLVYPEGTYLMWLDCSAMGIQGDELADFFIQKAGVAINRGDGFGKEGAAFVRLNIGCPRKTLEKGLNLILSEYKKEGY